MKILSRSQPAVGAIDWGGLLNTGINTGIKTLTQPTTTTPTTAPTPVTSPTGFNTGGNTLVGGMSITTVLLLGAGALVLYMATKKR